MEKLILLKKESILEAKYQGDGSGMGIGTQVSVE